MQHYDAIVLGTGGVGSAALHQLAKRGLHVLGLDRYPGGHSFGSSHGQTRIIRQAYFEHPDYVPLLRRAYELWDEVESESKQHLFHKVGLLEVGPPDGFLIPGVMQSVAEHGVPVEKFSTEEASKEFPFSIPESMQVVFEPEAGYLLVEPCVRAHLDLAIAAGAEWRRETVVDWSHTDTCVEVQTETEKYAADRLVICAGAWSGQLLKKLGVPLKVVVKQQYWFEPGASETASAIPTFFFELPEGCFYGFPTINALGQKVARHTGGEEVDGPVVLAGQFDEEDERSVTQFVSDQMPFCSGKVLSSLACMYTLSPDEHFIIDQHPETDRVVFAAGLSGHGFKFTTVLGELLADYATGADPPESAAFLRLAREY